jgi:hypothetical protein
MAGRIPTTSREASERESLEEFWRFNKKLNSGSIPLPPYDEACTILGLEPAHPALSHVEPGILHEIVFDAHQVVGVAMMVVYMLSKLRSVILGDEVGLGKSYEWLLAAHRVNQIRRMAAQNDAGSILQHLSHLLPIDEIIEDE